MPDWNKSHYLLNLTHFDGRNAVKVQHLRLYFSEFAWMKERLEVMVKYLIAVSPHIAGVLTRAEKKQIMTVVETFSLESAQWVVEKERIIRHDLKSLEAYFIQALPKGLQKKIQNRLNFGLGSEDINNIAFGRMLVACRRQVLAPHIQDILKELRHWMDETRDVAMIARTHGLPAGVTTFGKEVANTILRICAEFKRFMAISLEGKVSGEVGTFHATAFLSQDIDWMGIGDNFIKDMGLIPQHGATQIVPYDSLAQYLSSLYRIQAVLIDFCKNMWAYILLGYIEVKKVSTEIGSAGMPHKVNPIYFEGAEGGFEMANGIIETLVRKLMLNRLDRDFSDSTVRRNISIPLGLSVLSLQSVVEALKRSACNREVIEHDLATHAEVWIEPIKTIVRLDMKEDAYELLRQQTQGKVISQKKLEALVESLPVRASTKNAINAALHSQQISQVIPSIIRQAQHQVKQCLTI